MIPTRTLNDNIEFSENKHARTSYKLNEGIECEISLHETAASSGKFVVGYLSHYCLRSGDVVRGESDYKRGPHRALATPCAAGIIIAGCRQWRQDLHKMRVAEIDINPLTQHTLRFRFVSTS